MAKGKTLENPLPAASPAAEGRGEQQVRGFGDASAREKAILEHLPQVKLIARRIRDRLPGSVSLDDLISAGVIGLIAAIDRYDSSQGVRLNTYAEYKIRGAILDGLRTLDWAPRQHRRRARLIESAISALEQEHHRVPSGEEVAGALQLTAPEYQEWLSDIHGLAVGSLEQAGGEDDRSSLLRHIADSEERSPLQLVERAALEQFFTEAIETMPRLEKTVLNLYYYEEKTLRQIANIVDLHESRISQLKTQGIHRLRSCIQKRWPLERGRSLHPV